MSCTLMKNDCIFFKSKKGSYCFIFLTLSHCRSVLSPLLRPQRGSGQCRGLTLSLHCVRRPSVDAIPNGRGNWEARRKGQERWRQPGQRSSSESMRSEMCVKTPVATRKPTAFRLPAGSGATCVAGGTRCVLLFSSCCLVFPWAFGVGWPTSLFAINIWTSQKHQ